MGNRLKRRINITLNPELHDKVKQRLKKDEALSHIVETYLEQWVKGRRKLRKAS